MKKVQGCLLCVASLLLLVLVFGFDASNRNYAKDYRVNGKAIEYAERIMGMAVVDDTSFLNHLEKREMEENTQIFFENTIIPYEASTNILYVAQNNTQLEWEGELTSGKDTFLCTRKDEYWDRKADAIKENHEFPVWLLTEDGYYELSMVVTSLPVISMTTERIEEAEDIPYEVDPDKKFYGSETQHYGQIRIFNPGVGTTHYEITESNVRYHEKGISSSVYPKDGYSLSLLDDKEDNLNISLLGMRSDNSWKLNALMSDQTKVREKTAAQIWEQIDLANATINEAGPRMEYVEVILDNEYLGLYCLVEPVDEKKLELDANDVLYKIIDWGAPSDEGIQLSIANKWRISLPARIRYPDSITDYEAVWYPLRDYLNVFYRDYWQYGGYQGQIDLGNACDMVIFMMACSASDNSFKNLYLAADVTSTGEYRMRHIPWDLDLTFGNTHDPEAVNGIRFNDDVTVRYWDAPISTMIHYEIEGVEAELLNRWMDYRKTILSTNNILQIMEANRNELVNSGVYIREKQRWPEYGANDDITELTQYQMERMIWLDEYFQDIK